MNDQAQEIVATDPTQVRPPVDVSNDDHVLNYTQSVRVGIVHELTRTGKVPAENSDRHMLMSALDGLDRAALGKKRIMADQAQTASDSAAQKLISQMLVRMSGRRNAVAEDAVEIPRLTAEVPEPVLVPGETAVDDGEGMNYEKFMKKYQD